MRHEGQPSVDEILASIKQVMARDNREAAAERRAPLRDSQPYRGTMTDPTDQDEADDVLELAAESALPEEDDGALADALIEDGKASGMRESLAALAMLSEPGARPDIVRSGETSLEGMAREMLRPMLAEWLDKNLPPMVERLVKAEIARIVGKRG